jgi:hypothetical protein
MPHGNVQEKLTKQHVPPKYIDNAINGFGVRQARSRGGKRGKFWDCNLTSCVKARLLQEGGDEVCNRVVQE